MEEASQRFVPMMNHIFMISGDPYRWSLKKGEDKQIGDVS